MNADLPPAKLALASANPGASLHDWPLVIEDHQSIQPSSSADSLGAITLPFSVPFGPEQAGKPTELKANISLFLGVDDWGEAWISRHGGGERLAHIDLLESDEHPGGKFGGHQYWSDTATAVLSSGEYELHVFQRNIDMKDNAYNASSWDYRLDGELIAPGGRKTPQCPCCVADGDEGGNSGADRALPRADAAPASRSATLAEKAADPGNWRNRSCGGTGVQAVSTENSLYWGFTFGSFRGMGGIPQGRVELMASDNLEGFESPAALRYNHPFAASVALPAGGMKIGERLSISRGAESALVEITAGGTLKLAGVFAGGGSVVNYDTAGAILCIARQMTDGSASRYNAETGELVSYTSPFGQTLDPEEMARYLQIIRDDSGSIRQIWNYWDGLVNIENAARNGYTISLYTAAQVTPASGLFEVKGKPFKQFLISKTPLKNELEIIERTPGRPDYPTVWHLEGKETLMIQGEGEEAVSTRRTGGDTGANLYQLVTEIGRGAGTNKRIARYAYELYYDSPAGYLLASRREGIAGEQTRATTYAYDAKGRKIRETHPDGGTWEWAYDDLGRETLRREPWAGGRVRETSTRYRSGVDTTDVAEEITSFRAEGNSGDPVELSRSVFSYPDIEHVKRVEKRTAALGSTEERLEITETWLATAPNPYARGRIKMQRAENGVETHYSYAAATEHGALYAETQETRVGGELVPGHSMRETRFITVDGNVARQESHALLSDGTWELLDAADYAYDLQNRWNKKTRANGRVSERAVTCDGRPLWEKDEDGIETTYAYDTARQLVETTRSATETTPETIVSYTRDALGNPLVTRTDAGPLSTEERAVYDSVGRLSLAIDAQNRATSYHYSQDERTLAVTLPSGAVLITETHPDGSVLRQYGGGQRDIAYATDLVKDGIRVTATVPAKEGAEGGNAERVVAGRTVADGFGQTIRTLSATTKNATMLTRRFTWNSFGRLVREELDGMAPITRSYDPFGNKTEEIVILDAKAAPTPQNARVTRLAYSKEKRADGIYSVVSATTYAAAGEPIVTSEATLVSSLSPVLESKTVSTDARGNHSARWVEYAGPTARDAKQTFPGIETPSVSHLVDGFETQTTDCAGIATAVRTRRYTAAGIATVLTDARGNATTTHTDAFGRTLRVTDAAGNATLYAYAGPHDHPTTVTDALGNVTRYAYDERGRNVAQWGAGTQPALYAYDNADRLVSLATFRAAGETVDTDPRERADGDVTTWSYHPATGLLLRKTFADGTHEDTAYDRFNRIKTTTNARGQQATRAYAPLTGELTRVAYADTASPEQRFAYNHLGQVTSITDISGTRAYAYNAYNELEGETMPGAGEATLAQTRDACGRATGYQLRLNGHTAQSAAWHYNSVGKLAEVTLNELAKPFVYGYNSGNGLLETLSYPNPLERHVAWEVNRDLVTQIAYKRPGSVNDPAKVDYTYDALGRPKERRDTFNTPSPDLARSYTYNPRGELTVETLSRGGANAYAYDNIGNRTRAQEGGGAPLTTYAANAVNQYACIAAENAGDADAFVPLYDADGNQTRLRTVTGTWNVAYNAENRPVRFEKEDRTTLVECAYDFMGRRCEKKVTENGVVTSHRRYLYRGYLLIAELDVPTDAALLEAASPVLRKTYLWDPSEPLATRVLAMSAFDETGAHQEDLFYTHDALKNTTALFGIKGGRRALYEYAAYGSILKIEGDAAKANPFRYSGEYADDELGLIYYNYRHYNPLDGRWISRDLVPDLLNVYSILNNKVECDMDLLGAVSRANRNMKAQHRNNVNRANRDAKIAHQKVLANIPTNNPTGSLIEGILEAHNLLHDMLEALRDENKGSIRQELGKGWIKCREYMAEHPCVKRACCSVVLNTMNVIFGGREEVRYYPKSIIIYINTPCVKTSKGATLEKYVSLIPELPLKQADNPAIFGEKVAIVAETYEMTNK